MLSNSIICPIITQPNNRFNSLRVDLRHHPNLMIPFFGIPLVNTNLIDPQPPLFSLLFTVLKLTQKAVQIQPNLKHNAIHQYELIALPCPPSIRQRRILWSRLEIKSTQLCPDVLVVCMFRFKSEQADLLNGLVQIWVLERRPCGRERVCQVGSLGLARGRIYCGQGSALHSGEHVIQTWGEGEEIEIVTRMRGARVAVLRRGIRQKQN